MRQMKVDKLGIDLLTHDPVVILKDVDGTHFLPILIGPKRPLSRLPWRAQPCRVRFLTT